MKHSISVIDVACIVREFLENEAKTLHISKGKMLKDHETKREMRKYLEVVWNIEKLSLEQL